MRNTDTKIEIVKSLSEYVSAVIKCSKDFDLPYGSLWFRGVSSKQLDLVPGFVWRNLTDEESAVVDFRIGLSAFLASSPKDPWELYSFMQHHGLPTRLLDWSKAPLTALFFALDYASDVTDRSPVVWVLDPQKMNKNLHDEDYVFVPYASTGTEKTADLISSYLPKPLRDIRNNLSAINKHPIAIEPPFSNPRILAQQGCFTVMGSCPDGLNKIPELSDALASIEIDPESVRNIRNELDAFGIRAEWIYQSIGKLAGRITGERCG
jgi:hypothetical protein